MRSVFLAALFAAALSAEAQKPAKPVLAPKAGIKTPGIQIPLDSLKPEAKIDVETPGWIGIGESVLIPNKSKDTVLRVDAKTNKPGDAITEVKQPCSGTVTAFGSLWIPSCGSQTLVRLDPKTRKPTATIASGAADVVQGIAASSDSVWLLTDSKSTLSRIDPITNTVAGELRVPANCTSLTFGETSLWLTCATEARLLRIDPVTNLVTKRIEVSAGARSVAFGDGSVWVFGEKDGKIDRIDPKTNKVIKTIDLLTPGIGGSIAFGEGALWVSQPGFPLTRIDTTTEKERVVQQFWGDGGGMITIDKGALWVVNAKGSVSRYDPKRVLATLPD